MFKIDFNKVKNNQIKNKNYSSNYLSLNARHTIDLLIKDVQEIN